MCEICKQCPCPSRCPNADAGEAPYYCDACGCPLYVGDTAYSVEEHIYCEECVTDGVFEIDFR